MLLLKEMQLGLSYRTSMRREMRLFVPLKLGRKLESRLCFRLLDRQRSLIIESRNSYARLRSYS